jgi:hypothetical protein
MNYKTMPIPERMDKLPKFKGIPIPFTTLIDDKGVPHFKLTNDNVWVSKRDGLCSMCGQPLDYWKAFMVSEEEAESRTVWENPQHEECLRYAFNVCPWLYYSKAKYTNAEDIKAVEGYQIFDAHPNRMESKERPKRLGIYICNNYKNVIVQKRYRVCKVSAPKRIEWIDGK